MRRASTVFYGSVCSGHCAVTQALKGRGWEPGFFSEIEAFPCAVLGQRFGASAPAHPFDPSHLPTKERLSWDANNRTIQRMSNWSFGSTVPNLGDFTKADPNDWLWLDWLWAGTPCQDYSVAGKREGLTGHRGNLTLDFVDFAHELAARGSLRGFTWENVPGVLSDRKNAFGCILGAIVGHDAAIVSPHGKGRWTDAGVVVGPRARATWRILDTQHFGLPQRRRRVYLVASFADGPDPVRILFEPKGLRRPAAPGSGAGKNVAGTLSARTGSSGGLGTDFELDGGLVPVPRLYSAMPMNSGRDFTVREVPVTQPLMAAGQVLGDQGGDFVLQPISPTITATYGKQSGQDQGHIGLVLSAVHAPSLAQTLRAEGFDASEDGTGRQTLVVHEGLRPLAFGGNNTAGPIDIATTRSAHADPHGRLDFETDTFIAEPIGYGRYRETDKVGARSAEGADCQGGSEVLIAFDTTQVTSAANRSNPKAGDTGHPLTGTGHAPTIAFNCRQDPVPSADVVGALDSDGYSQAIAFSVRGRHGEALPEAEDGNVSPALRTGGGGSSKGFIATAGDAVRWAVRRLTPVEAERLQGTADNFTRVRWRGKREEECPDGPRYKVIGNSKSINVVVWLGDRIREELLR